MTVHILYDNQTIGSQLESGWGFSCLIDGSILFDTGEAGPALIKNLNRMEIGIHEIEGIIISHPHWDHTGGVGELRRHLPTVDLYLPEGAAEHFPSPADLEGANYTVCAGPTAVGPVETSGTFHCEYKGAPMPEQGVRVETAKGISLITGCAHPGVLVMAEELANRSPDGSPLYPARRFPSCRSRPDEIESTFARIKSLGFKRIIATHCSGETARELGDYRTGVGDIIAL